MKKIKDFLSSLFKKREPCALEDAYRIHGDGVATMIPEKLVKREQFQKNLKEIADWKIGGGSGS